MSSQTSGRSRDSIPARTARKSWPLGGRMAVTKSAASFWAAARTTKRCANGWRRRRVSRGSSASLGRTDFWEPLVNWRAKKITREDAVAEIARRYREFVDIFEKEKVRAA